jgi:hypothetical protein
MLAFVSAREVLRGAAAVHRMCCWGVEAGPLHVGLLLAVRHICCPPAVIVSDDEAAHHTEPKPAGSRPAAVQKPLLQGRCCSFSDVLQALDALLGRERLPNLPSVRLAAVKVAEEAGAGECASRILLQET